MVGVIIPIGIGGILFFVAWLWAVLDCIAADPPRIRNLPKTAWLFVVIMIPTAGALAWLLLGRPEGIGFGLGGTYRPANFTKRSRSRGFEDSPEWMARSKQIKAPRPSRGDGSDSNAIEERDLTEWEAELKKHKDALDDDLPPQPSD